MLIRRRLLLVTINALLVIALLTTDLFGNGSVSVASAHVLPASPQVSTALNPAQPYHAAMPFSTSAAANSPTNLCQLYPIGLGNMTMAGVAIGGTVNGVVFGIQPGTFDWLSWTGDRTEATLLTSLTPPGNSSSYVNPSNSSDHSLDPGDSVFGRPTAVDDTSTTNKLNALEAQDITVPVFDQGTQNGDVRTLRVIGFASIRLTGFHLQTSPGPQTISFIYNGSVSCTPNSPGDTLLLTPQAAGPDVTTTAQTVQATLKDRARNPISGVSVTFTVTGANATSGNVTTDNNGVAAFTYQGNTSGTDTVQATATVMGFTFNSNQATVSWITPTQPVSTTPVWGRFFYPNFGVTFNVQPPQTPVFTEAFPTLDFNPPAGTIPGQPAGVDDNARPMLNVVTDPNGNYAGTIVAQGNGYQAGVAPMDSFAAVFTGAFVVASTSDLTFTFLTDDGYILGVSNGATLDSGTLNNPPASGMTPFEEFPVLSAKDGPAYGPPGTATIHFPGPGLYPYEIDYFECCGGELSMTVVSNTSNGTIALPPTGTLLLTPSTVPSQPTGTSQSFSVTATSATGTPLANLPVELAIGGANGQQLFATTTATGTATFSYTGLTPGTDGVQAIAWISSQAIYSNQVSLQWTPPATPPPTPPIATPGWIGSPATQSQVSGQVPITLANNITLQTGTVDYWPTANPSAVTTLATNVSGTGGVTLATLDTTTLPNGSYIVRLQGTDNTGTQLNSEVLVTVIGQNKPGRVTFSVTDLTVPVTGLPITIGRTYDSLLRSQSGDFGNGWNLTIGTPKLMVDPAHNVTLTLPDGRRVTFYFTPQSPGGVLGYLLIPSYTPDPGVYGSLTANGCGLLALSAGQYFCFLSGQYQPTTYTYTDPYGRVYVMDASTGTLTSVTDLDGNTLTITPQGITSSAGNLSVPFVRDSQGRITQITDPAGNVYHYSYDSNGNLASVTFPGVATPVTYTYDSSHLLLTVQDPRGNTTATTSYYPDGRLKTTTDPLGNITSFSYNLSANTTTVTAPDGGVTTYTYDNFGMLLTQTDPLGHTTTYTYDSNHNLTSVTDPLGHTTSYTYDSQGNQTSMTDPLGHTTSIQYNRFGGPTTITDALGNIQTITYDAMFHPASVTDGLGTLEQYTYDSHGQPLTMTDGNGQTTSYTYDQFGNLTSVKDALGNVTSYTYDALGRKLTSTDARGNTTKYTYDALGHLLTVTDPLGQVTTSTYDADGNQLTTTDALGHTTSYAYDALNRLIKTTYPDGTTTSTTYDFRGQPLTQTNQAGQITTYTYDTAGEELSETTASGTSDAATTQYAYDAAGRRVKITDPLGNVTTTAYDAAGHTAGFTAPLGDTTSFTYDADGRPIAVTDANGHTTRYTYDARGRQTVTTYADGTTVQQSYDGVGNVLTQTDQAGAVTTYTYDADNHLLSVANPLNQKTSYTYDPNGNLLTITDANGHTTSYTYDADNQQTKETWPDGSSESYTYDAAGNQISDLLRDGHTNTSTYDAMNRLTKLTYFDGTSVSYTYTPTGQQATVTDGRGVTSYTYDNQDRLIQETVPSGLSVAYTYDADGNRASMTTPAGTTSYAYDADNRLASVSATGVGTTTYTYDAVGNRTAMVLPNGVNYEYKYDALNRLSSLAEYYKGGPILGAYAYTRGPTGILLSEQGLNGSDTFTWTYDAAYRLTGETRVNFGTTTYQASYTYDAVGNRTSATINGQTTNYTYNSLDQLTSTSAGAQDSYDGRGNLTQVTNGSSTTSYSYDAADRLTSVTLPGGTTASYAYDADGRRVQQTVGSNVTNYLWDEASTYGDVVLETDGSGAIQASYVLGNGQVLTQTRSGVTSYYLYDGQGSVRGLTNSAGAVTDSYSYDAFGNLLTSQGSTLNPYRYDGQYFDSLTGLYNLRARYYDPATGRFTSADTAEVMLDDPTELNRYLYASSNPINLSDPSGHDAGDEEAAIYANVDESAIPRAEEFGKDEASEMAANAATQLAGDARTLKDVAVFEYEVKAIAEGWPPIPPRFIMGRVGIGLTDFLTAFGRVRLAALNNVGISRSHGIDWEDTAKALEKYYEVLRGLARAEGYYILYPGAILRGATADVDHEEKYLAPAVRAFTRAMPPKSYAFLGVSQDTVCGKCLALYFGRPDWGFAARFRYPLDPAREVWLAVSGANPAAGIFYKQGTLV